MAALRKVVRFIIWHGSRVIDVSLRHHESGRRHRDYGHYSCRAISMMSASAI
jgi:hypothetical protein